MIKRTIKEHKRIIFNGDGYSEEWIEEAKKRGLLNLVSTVDALPHYIKEKNIALFEKHGVLCKEEMLSRYEILVESYINVVRIEAATLAEMVSIHLDFSFFPSRKSYIYYTFLFQSHELFF